MRYYKSERQITFHNFLAKLQRMYNIYESHGEPMTEEAKIRFLFKKIRHEGLIKTCETMKTNIATEAVGTITYTAVTNHLSNAISKLPNYLARHRNVSSVYGNKNSENAGNSGGKQSGPGQHHGILNAYRSIHTGQHPNWMSRTDPED